VINIDGNFVRNVRFVGKTVADMVRRKNPEMLRMTGDVPAIRLEVSADPVKKNERYPGTRIENPSDQSIRFNKSDLSILAAGMRQ
jgi:hypothetical protein